MDAISVSGVSKRFRATEALRDVDLRVAAGEVVALVGRNGAGKSTLVRVVATVVVPDTGRVVVNGADAVRDPVTARRRCGLTMGDERSFFWRLTARENLRFFAALHGLGRRQADDAVDAALAAVGLVEAAEVRVDRYSTGMRSRLGVARAVLGDPAVLLLDEPTRSLDPLSAGQVRRLVLDLARRRGMAVLLVTHDGEEVARLAHRVVVLDRGRVAAELAGSAVDGDLEAVLEAVP
jgi:ABC-2 type transport system ATP-binding protein